MRAYLNASYLYADHDGRVRVRAAGGGDLLTLTACGRSI